MIFNVVFFQRLDILKLFITTETLHYGCNQAEIAYFALEDMPARKRARISRRPRRKLRRYQRGGFLNWFDFAYADRDTANTAMNRLEATAPKLIADFGQGKLDGTGKDLSVAQWRRIKNQKNSTEIIRGAIEDVYKTPFRLPGNFGRRKLTQIKRRLKGLIGKK